MGILAQIDLFRTSLTTQYYKQIKFSNFCLEFYFVANDAYPEVLNYLLDKNIPHYTHNNTQEQIKNDWYISTNS